MSSSIPPVNTKGKPKLCRTALAGLILFALTVLSPVMPMDNSFFIAIGLFVSFTLAVISLFIIALTPVPLQGKELSYTIITLCIISFLLFISQQYCHPKIPERLTCNINLRGLGTALMVYENDFIQLPDMDVWQDKLIEEADTGEKIFICPSFPSQYPSYAINKYLYDIPFEQIPDNIVVLFEASPRYEGERNISGGPEILNITNHKNLGMNVLFYDGSTEFVKAKKLPTLKWSNDPDFQFPQQTESYLQLHGKEEINTESEFKYPLIIVSSILAVCVLLLIFYRRPVIIYVCSSIIIGLFWSELKFASYQNEIFIIVCSIPMWLIACAIIHKALTKLEPKYYFAFSKNLATLVGSVVGIIVGMLWLVPQTIFITEKHITGEEWLEKIIFYILLGFWFGALQGWIWRKIFIDHKIKEKKSAS